MRRSSPCAMIKEGSTCPLPSFVSPQMQGLCDSTRCEIGHSRMELQSELTGPWLKESQPCLQSLVFPCLSGARPLPPLCTSKADHELYPRVWVPIPTGFYVSKSIPGLSGFSGTRYLYPRVFRNQVPDTCGFSGTVRNRP